MIKTRSLSWLLLTVLPFLPGCPTGGGGDSGLGETAPSSVAVSPNGSFLYVSNRGLNTVSAYTIGGSGTLAPIAGSPFAAGTNPSAVTVSPNGSFLYVSNQGSNNVSAYTIGGAGAITAITGSPFASGAAPSGVAVSPNGSFLYVSNQGSNNVSAYTITPGTGVLVPIASNAGNPFAAGTSPSAVTVSPLGNFLYVSNQGSNNVSAYTITAGTGVLVPVASGIPFAAGTSPSAVTVSPNGSFLYVSNQGSNNVSAYTITAGTGVLVPIASNVGNPFAAGTSPSAVTASPNGGFLYVSNQGSHNVSAYTITGGTGGLASMTGSPF